MKQKEMNKFDYENKTYLGKLDELSESYYSKYISFIEKYLKDKKDKFLDVGCGNGKNLQLLKESGFINGYGCDISELFINEAKRRGLKNVKKFDGVNFPYKGSDFSLVGSFNVLEHVENPEDFITAQIYLLKKKGYIIIACPNFLSVLFRNDHRRLKGMRRKISNLLIILSKLISPTDSFERMRPVIRKNFEYDDDAIVVTNLIDLKNLLNKNNCTIIYVSGFINYDKPLYKFINSLPFMKYLLPSCFVVARKN